MRGYASYHPVTLLIYFAAVLSIAMFINNPVILISSLIGAALYHLIIGPRQFLKNILYDIGLFVIIAAVNPFVSHRGKTILFFINEKPVTMEALVYGIFMAVMIVAVLNWCKIFSKVMSEDKLLYLFGRISSNLALVISMALRYIPLFQKQAAKVSNSQAAMGLYSKEEYMDKVKGRLMVFSIVLTWSLENAMDTASSMRARGYGIGKRTQYALFRMTVEDGLMILLSLLLFGIVMAEYGGGAADFAFYPKLGTITLSWNAMILYISYGLLVLLPACKEMKERLKWIYYKSRI